MFMASAIFVSSVRLIATLAAIVFSHALEHRLVRHPQYHIKPNHVHHLQTVQQGIEVVVSRKLFQVVHRLKSCSLQNSKKKKIRCQVCFAAVNRSRNPGNLHVRIGHESSKKPYKSEQGKNRITYLVDLSIRAHFSQFQERICCVVQQQD